MPALWLVCCGIFLLPLACWPGDGAFSVPKLLLLTCLDVALLAILLLRRPRPHATPAGEWLALGWVAAVSISALSNELVRIESLALAVLPLPLFWAMSRPVFPADAIARAIWLGSSCEAGIVVLQFCGLDPLALLGWRTEVFANPRMRMYGTLGNPNFVAAWCCATLPFCWREIAAAAPGRPRALRWAAAALQILAILATGSRVFALVVPLQACAALLGGNRRLGRAWALTLAAAVPFLWLSPARPLSTTIQGRLHLLRLTAGGWNGPLAGHGPGSFEVQFGRRQVEWLRTHPGPASMRFAGVVDHAHNDYVEFLVEYGSAAAGVFLALCGWAAAQAWRRRAEPHGTARWAAATGAASLMAIAAVDFPFHRPAEWSLLWLYLGILTQQRMANPQGASE